MRGKPLNGLVDDAHAGLIPAHAGKTYFGRVRLLGVRAHPRACGENESLLGPGFTDAGSSPRMRGKLREAEGLSVSPGLIPAHAGKTYAH